MNMNDNFKKRIVILCLIKGIYSCGFSILFISLALFINSSLKTSEGNAAHITAIFLALSYGLSIIGGFIGNNYISFKKMFGSVCVFNLLDYSYLAVLPEANT